MQLFGRVLRNKRDRADVRCELFFPDAAHTRWLGRVPTPGTRIRSVYGDPYSRHAWVVKDVVQSGHNTYAVFCVEWSEYADSVLHGSGGKPDMSAELLELARRATDTIADLRHRRKYRHYLP